MVSHKRVKPLGESPLTRRAVAVAATATGIWALSSVAANAATLPSGNSSGDTVGSVPDDASSALGAISDSTSPIASIGSATGLVIGTITHTVTTAQGPTSSLPSADSVPGMLGGVLPTVAGQVGGTSGSGKQLHPVAQRLDATKHSTDARSLPPVPTTAAAVSHVTDAEHGLKTGAVTGAAKRVGQLPSAPSLPNEGQAADVANGVLAVASRLDLLGRVQNSLPAESLPTSLPSLPAVELPTSVPTTLPTLPTTNLPTGIPGSLPTPPTSVPTTLPTLPTTNLPTGIPGSLPTPPTGDVPVATGPVTSATREFALVVEQAGHSVVASTAPVAASLPEGSAVYGLTSPISLPGVPSAPSVSVPSVPSFPAVPAVPFVPSAPNLG